MIHRLATSKDADQIINILNNRAQWLDSKGIFQWPTDWMALQEKQIRSDIAKNLYHVCIIDDSVCATYRLTQEPEEYWNDDVDAVYLSKLAVALPYSGTGMGYKIMSLVEKATSNEYIRLDSISGNLFLGAFYKQLGYQYVRTENLNEITIDLYELIIKNSRSSMLD